MSTGRPACQDSSLNSGFLPPADQLGCPLSGQGVQSGQVSNGRMSRGRTARGEALLPLRRGHGSLAAASQLGS